MSSIKKFALHYSHFFTGSVLSLLLGFITFPILTRILTKEQYGVLGLVTTTLLVLVALAKAGLSDGIIRFYRDYSEAEGDREVFSSTILYRGLLFSTIAAVVYVLCTPWLIQYLGIDNSYLICFFIMSVYLFIRPMNIIVLNLLRATGNTIFLNVSGLVSRIAGIALSLLLLIYIVRELYGYFVGYIIGELVLTLILFHWFYQNFKKNQLSKISGTLAVKLIKFGIPLLLTELSWLLLTYADRYLIVGYLGAESLGVYSVGYNMAMYISDIITFSLSYSIIPIYVDTYGKEGKEQTEKFLEKSLRYVLIAIIPLCVGYYAVAAEFITLVASTKYASAAIFSPLILVGSLLIGLNYIFNAGLYLQKKSNTILAIMLFGMVVKILLTIVLISKYDLMGAAIATLVSALCTNVLTILTSYKYIKIKIDILSVAKYALLSLAMLLLLSTIHTGSAWLNLFAKITVGAAVVVSATLLMEKDILNFARGLSTHKKG
jgi:O-antigen/teichoic acid export membrane protein